MNDSARELESSIYSTFLSNLYDSHKEQDETLKTFTIKISVPESSRQVAERFQRGRYRVGCSDPSLYV